MMVECRSKRNIDIGKTNRNRDILLWHQLHQPLFQFHLGKFPILISPTFLESFSSYSLNLPLEIKPHNH